MKAIVIADTESILTVRVEADITEDECRTLVGVEGTYHKRNNGLWIISKA